MVPVGPACLACASVQERAFPGVSWSELVGRAKSDPDFAKSIALAKQHLLKAKAGQEPKEWIQETLDEDTEYSVVVERSLIFLAATEFERLHGCKIPSDQVLEEITDETGQKVKGLILQDTAAPWRRIRLERRTGLSLHRELGRPADMLRAGQNADLMQYLKSDEAKKQSRGWKHPLTGAEMQQLIERARSVEKRAVKDSDVVEPAPLEAPHSHAEHSGAPQEQTGAEADLYGEEEEDQAAVSHLPVSAAALRLQESTDAGNAKKRGQGKANAAKKAAKPKQSSRSGMHPPLPKRAKTDAAGSGSGSACGPSSVSEEASARSRSPGSKRTRLTKKGSPQGKLESMQMQATKWVTDLKAAAYDVLSGKVGGNQLYQARRVLEALENLNQKDSTEYINLCAMKCFVEQCEVMTNVNRLCAMDPQAREKALEEMYSYLEEVPSTFQVALCTCHARAMTMDNEAGVKEWIAMVQPPVTAADSEGWRWGHESQCANRNSETRS